MSKWTDEQCRRFYKSYAWKKKRIKVLEIDNYECRHCKEQGRLTTQHDATLEVDHIKELKDYPELSLEENNLQTLCRTCHNIKHGRFGFERKESKWEDERW